MKPNERYFTRIKKMAANDQSQLRQAEMILNPIAEKFGLRVVQRNSSAYGEEIIFQNDIAGVKVRRSDRDGKGLLVTVAKLIGGEFPSHPGTINEQTKLFRFDIRDVATVRTERLSETLSKKIRNDSPLNATDVKALLTSCCSDVLMGDFSIFNRTSQLVKERAKRLADEFPTEI
jgi:hypothetical protein